jgi:hypothetical protein
MDNRCSRLLSATAIVAIAFAACGHDAPALPGANAAANHVWSPAASGASAPCEERVNDTPAKLEPCVGAPSLWQRLSKFQSIADEHPGPSGHGNRDTGTAGYKASVDYVVGLMRKAGYAVTIQPYQYKVHFATGTRRFPSPKRYTFPYPVSGTDYNVIADSPYGDVHHTVVIEAHLDAIFGAGMLDNASGSTSILQTALALAKTPTHNHLRFIWFGGEELGLLGSHYYTQNLTKSQLHDIVFDVDADVTATPNFDILIADPANARNVKKFPPNVVPQSMVGNQDFEQYFSNIGIPSRSASFGNGGTDSNSFSLVGVPNTGVLTMQDCCKLPAEVKIWGGFTGDYEGAVPGVLGECVDYPRRWCDNLSNNDPFIFGLVSKAIGVVTQELANDANLHR